MDLILKPSSLVQVTKRAMVKADDVRQQRRERCSFWKLRSTIIYMTPLTLFITGFMARSLIPHASPLGFSVERMLSKSRVIWHCDGIIDSFSLHKCNSGTLQFFRVKPPFEGHARYLNHNQLGTLSSFLFFLLQNLIGP